MRNAPCSSSLIQKPPHPTVVILGMFDGVHLGHQTVVETGVALAQKTGLAPWVFSFATHPKKVMHAEHSQVSAWEGNQLTSLSERLQLLSTLGVKGAYCPEFSAELKNLSPESFCRTLLHETLQAQILVVGYDFRFGKDRAGSADWLVEHQHALGFQQVVVVSY
jgi:riboflavin kinase / FMN adenylyltransferase